MSQTISFPTMSSTTSDPDPLNPSGLPTWLSACRQRLNAPPAVPRTALLLNGQPIGSLHPDLLADSALFWPPASDPTEALERWADHLRATRRCGAWRSERVTVRSADGVSMAAVERGAVRVLGIRTEAVHLVGRTPEGRVWLQQRAFDKPNDPGLWDTLVGGLVAHGETLVDTLQRETWEEAGLRLQVLAELQAGGAFEVIKPSADGRGLGHMVETIHWFTAVLPPGLAPVNQDGEVECFEVLEPDAVRARVLAGQCTDEAAWVLALALGWPLPVNGR